ncbi:MAG TPA: hypothetical protein VJ553_04050 [Candidatus Paceibacterota bacterium]|nr:hypothetical protein [Candidatus Paceibacterota bacterium]
MVRRLHHRITYFTSSFVLVFALVMIWRGVWYILDGFDRIFFDGNHFVSIIGGIILGFTLLYLPDKDLKEIRKL